VEQGCNGVLLRALLAAAYLSYIQRDQIPESHEGVRVKLVKLLRRNMITVRTYVRLNPRRNYSQVQSVR
jgi:hypothetical protein